MYKKYSKMIMVLVGGALVLAACAPKKPVPQVASSAESEVYAIEYPEVLNGQVTEYKAEAATADEKGQAFGTYPDLLSDPDWQKVYEVIEAADRDGRGRAYAERVAETDMARQFFEREKEDITRRINGAVTSGAEKASCNCQLDSYGNIAYALKESVDRKLKDRLMEPSEAYLLIARYEQAIGKKNIDPLKAQAADIAYAAHVVYVMIPTTYQEMERRVAEAKKVKATLQDAIESEKAAAQQPNVSKKEKKAIEKRIEGMKASLEAVDGYKTEAEQLVAKAETDIPALQDRYRKAFDSLRDKIKGKIKK